MQQRDYNALLLDALRALLRDQLQYESVMSVQVAADAPVRISLRQIEERAKLLGLMDLQPFYESALFTANNFELRADEGVIVHPR